jgi:hypothetical protein
VARSYLLLLSGICLRMVKIASITPDVVPKFAQSDTSSECIPSINRLGEGVTPAIILLLATRSQKPASFPAVRRHQLCRDSVLDSGPPQYAFSILPLRPTEVRPGSLLVRPLMRRVPFGVLDRTRSFILDSRSARITWMLTTCSRPMLIVAMMSVSARN